jgi:hypothetical protein
MYFEVPQRRGRGHIGGKAAARDSEMGSCRRIAVSLLLASACSVADPSFYESVEGPLGGRGGPGSDAGARADAGSDAGQDAAADAGGDAASADAEVDAGGGTDAGPATPTEPFLTDRCPLNQQAFFLHPGTTSITVDTTDLNNDVHQGTGLKCTSYDAPGNDGFLGIEMKFGDVWHIHSAPDPDPDAGAKNPAFYVLDSTCAVRDCGFGIDVCDQGVDEHFTFAARRDGIYYLGIDDRTPGGGKYVFTANRVECGNGLAQHGKACDFRKDPDCDNECRIVLDSVNPRESSKAHDDFTVANVITFPATGAQTANVGGNIGGCEPDYYTFNAKQGDSVRITLLNDAEQPCSTTEGRFALELETARAERLIAGAATDDNTCPSLTREDLVEWRYYVKLADTLLHGEDSPFGYKLRIELNPL